MNRRNDGLDREQVPMLPVLLACVAVAGFVSALVLAAVEALG